MSKKYYKSEVVLGDDYPLHIGYLYILDGVISRVLESTDVGTMKRNLGVREIRKCSIKDRNLWSEMI